MKKAMIWMVFATLAVLTACGALAAGEIVLPEAEDLEKATVTASELDLTSAAPDFIAALLETLGQAKNTGRASVQDVPEKGAGLIRFDFEFKAGGTSTLFLYREGESLLLEQPYQGIYELDSSLEEQFRTQIALELARQITEQEVSLND